MKKFKKLFLIIILLIVFSILGFIATNYLFEDEPSEIPENESINSSSSQNNTISNQLSEDDKISKDEKISEEDKKQLEDLYLPLFISINKNDNQIGILNKILYCFNLQGIENTNGSELFLKADVDNIVKKLYGQKSDLFLSNLSDYVETDSQNKHYISHGNDEDVPYNVTIKELNLLDGDIYQAKVQFYLTSDSNYANFLENYENQSNATGSGNLADLYEDMQIKYSATIEFKKLDDIVKYQFIKLSYSNTDNIVLYNGLDIACTDLDSSISYNDENKENYEITYYNYENGKFLGESKGKLEQTYEGVASVSNTKKVAMSQKYDAIPRKYKTIEDLPDELSEYANNNNVELHSIDLDGDNTLEYVLAYSSSTSPEDSNVEEYSNSSEILVFDSNFNKIASLAYSQNQFWEHDGIITDEFFLSLADVEYIDIDNDNIMEILLNTNVYEGNGVNIYKYKNGVIVGDIDCNINALP